MRRIGLVAAVVAAGLAIASLAFANTTTKVTMDAAFYNPGETQFAGDVISSKKACKNGRKVAIFRVRSGKDKKLATTTSFKGLADNGYYWTYAHPGAAPKGKYYAKVSPTSRCAGDKSNVMKLA